MVPLAKLHERYRHWLGEHYDLDAIDSALCVAAVEKLDGDPLWLLIVSGSGMAKSETVVPIASCPGAVMVSTIASEGALLSMSSAKDRVKNATGGLLRELGDRGLMVIKDFTTILSMPGDRRAAVLAALREIYDSRWDRRAGVDGGVIATWQGRIGVLGAVTTAWDSAHAVISMCGDRFTLLRVDSSGDNRAAVAKSTMRAIGRETEMRDELSRLAAGVVAGVDPNVDITLTDDEIDKLIAAADLVTRCRTAVERDFQKNPEWAHAPEAPTRFMKQLAQVFRGCAAIGMPREAALRLAIRVARDSMPPRRLRILDYLAEHPHSSTQDVRKGLGEPYKTIDRELQCLTLLKAVACVETHDVDAVGDVEYAGNKKWLWRLADGIDNDVLKLPPTVATFSHPGCVPDAAADSNSFYVRVAESGNSFKGSDQHVSKQCYSCDSCETPLESPESIDAGLCAECRYYTEQAG